MTVETEVTVETAVTVETGVTVVTVETAVTIETAVTVQTVETAMTYIKLLLYISLIWKQIRILFAYHLRVMENILSLTACFIHCTGLANKILLPLIRQGSKHRQIIASA